MHPTQKCVASYNYVCMYVCLYDINYMYVCMEHVDDSLPGVTKLT